MLAGAVPSPPSHSRGRVLASTGGTRAASTNTALCRTATGRAPDGATVTVFVGLTALPHFDPDDDHDPLPPAMVGLRAAIA